MVAGATAQPILPAHSDVVWWAYTLLFAVTVLALAILFVFVVRKLGWHLGYQLERFRR